jgi:hypothetical protein
MDEVTLQTNDIVEVRRIVSAPDAVVGTEVETIKVVGCEKYVLKTSSTGMPGPKGDTSTFNDLEIDSLAVRFLGRLV